MKSTFSSPLFICDFCGLDETEVATLVRGPRDVCICKPCIDLAWLAALGFYTPLNRTSAEPVRAEG